MFISGKLGRRLLLVALGLVVLGLVFALGTILNPSAPGGDGVESVSSSYSGAPDAERSAVELGAPSSDEVKASDAAAAEQGSTPSDSKIIRTGSIDVRVDDVDESVTSVRAVARQFDAEISDLTIQSGNPDVRPLQGDSSTGYSGPATAYVTLRVAAEKLELLQREMAKLGTVTAQTSSANDVTEQYVDLSARMKNLKAEEARLRSFFGRTDKVSDLLDVERELARVRGEIEAMQAQIDYLDRQSARATLAVTLTEPGPIVGPGDDDWGFRDAVTRGVQGAVAVLTTLITGAIALAPIALAGALVWAVVMLIRRRRATTRENSAIDDEQDGDDA